MYVCTPQSGVLWVRKRTDMMSVCLSVCLYIRHLGRTSRRGSWPRHWPGLHTPGNRWRGSAGRRGRTRGPSAPAATVATRTRVRGMHMHQSHARQSGRAQQASHQSGYQHVSHWRRGCDPAHSANPKTVNPEPTAPGGSSCGRRQAGVNIGSQAGLTRTWRQLMW